MRISPINFKKINFSSTDRTIYCNKQDGGEFDKMGDALSISYGHSSYGDNLPMFLKHLGFRPADMDFCNPYNSVLKIGEYHDSIFLHEPELWLEQVKDDYKDYKLAYGIY